MTIPNQYLSLLLLFLMAAVTSTHAQTGVSVKAGAHYSNLIIKDASGDRRNTQFKPGWQVGLAVDIPLGRALYLQPNLLYARKGFTQDDSWFAGAGNDFKVAANYIELPLNFLYKPMLGNGRLLIGAGPYLGYGTGGQWKSDENIVIGDIIHDDHGNVNFKKDIADGEFGDYLYGKPWDYGATIIAGYEFADRFSALFNLQLGLANIEPNIDGSPPEDTIRNIGFGIALGYEL